MVSKPKFLESIWHELIDPWLTEHWIDNCLRNIEQGKASSPFGEVDMIVKRLLECGASREELSRLARFAAYETAFGFVCMIEDHRVPRRSVEGLHEGLLGADPSGRDGRPGP